MKRRSQPKETKVKKNNYGRKMASGNRVYGPGCCAHKRTPQYPPKGLYWWGEVKPAHGLFFV